MKNQIHLHVAPDSAILLQFGREYGDHNDIRKDTL